ncbi:MAG: ankyrin repeat domain-containing protein [Sphingomonas sp.]|jgi:ankyrin repeat protein
MFLHPLRFMLAMMLAFFALGSTATAQIGQSKGYLFLEAIKDAKSEDVKKYLSEPGTRIVDTKDYSTGETALHIVAKRGDAVYTRYLLAQGANPNLRDVRGNTPLLVATGLDAGEVVAALIKGKASVNLGNDSGETPLIRAVQLRSISLVRALLAAGADPDQADSLAGYSARDYARQDTRTPLLAKLIDEVPKRDRRAVAGPKF